MAKSLNTKPIKKHLESYALVSDAHRTTHRILKEQNETILKMRTILTQFKELPEQYGKRLMSTNETLRLKKEEDDIMRILRKTQEEFGLRDTTVSKGSAEDSLLSNSFKNDTVPRDKRTSEYAHNIIGEDNDENIYSRDYDTSSDSI